MSLFARLAHWRRRRTLRRFAFSDRDWEALLARYPFIARRDASALARLRESVSLFCAGKEFAGAGGYEVDTQTQLAIAAQACLPVLYLDLSLYDGWTGVIVYPGEVVARREYVDDDGVVHEYDEAIAGEAMPGGPVVLSWEDVKIAGSDAAPAYNVVIHEFAHKIDMLKGPATGVPPFLPRFHAGFDARGFADEITRAWQSFARAVSRWERRGAHDIDAPLIDPYAAESQVEFFAVATEAFFTQPEDVLAQFPELYPRLVGYYLQDPLAATS